METVCFERKAFEEFAMKIPWAIDTKTGEWLRADRAVSTAPRN